MGVTRVGDIDIYTEVHGDPDAPWVLNIGGSGGDLRQTFPDRSPLNRAFRVLSFDQRGLGQTSRPDGEYTMAQYADDAAGLIRHVIGGPCHVVGTSFGGMVALELVVRHPELVDRLVLMCTSPGGDHPSYPLHTLDQLPPDEAFAIRMRNTDVRWDPDAAEPIPGLGPVYDVIAGRGQSAPSDEVRDGVTRQLAARSRHDVVDALPTIEHDTLVCAGRFDGTAPLENSQILADRMPNARLEVFDGGHLFWFQDRRAFPTVIEFLSAARG